MCQWIGSALVQIMACRLFGAKPLSKPMLVYCQLDAIGINFTENLTQTQNFSLKKMHLKITSAKWRPFCPGELSSLGWHVDRPFVFRCVWHTIGADLWSDRQGQSHCRFAWWPTLRWPGNPVQPVYLGGHIDKWLRWQTHSKFVMTHLAVPLVRCAVFELWHSPTEPSVGINTRKSGTTTKQKMSLEMLTKDRKPAAAWQKTRPFRCPHRLHKTWHHHRHRIFPHKRHCHPHWAWCLQCWAPGPWHPLGWSVHSSQGWSAINQRIWPWNWLLWCKVNIQSSRILHIDSFYRPDMSDSNSLDELASSLARIPTNYLVIFSGDFNLPDWDWSTGTPILKPGFKHPDYHTKLNDIIANHGLTQHITEPTKQDPHHSVSNTLDLIRTNCPSSVISSSVVPGTSDHNGTLGPTD